MKKVTAIIKLQCPAGVRRTLHLPSVRHSDSTA